MQTNRFSVTVSALALAALLSVTWLTMPDLVEAKSVAPITDYSHISASGGPVLYIAERGVAIVDYSHISAAGGPVLYTVESSNLDRSDAVESIPGRVTQERIRDEQALDAGSVSVDGATAALEAGIPYSEYLRATQLGGEPAATFESTSDVLRDEHLGGAQTANFESTSDVLRDRRLGGGATVETVTPSHLHDEWQGGAGYHPGR